jgi:hypothetical protein
MDLGGPVAGRVGGADDGDGVCSRAPLEEDDPPAIGRPVAIVRIGQDLARLAAEHRDLVE